MKRRRKTRKEASDYFVGSRVIVFVVITRMLSVRERFFLSIFKSPGIE